MIDDLSVFKKVSRQIVGHMREGRPVTLKPSDRVADDFDAALDLVEKEQSRIHKIRTRGGRPRTQGPVSRATQAKRDYRDRLKKKQQSYETA